MKALVKVRTEPGLWLEDVPEPECGRDEVLIRVLRTGICGTDLHIYLWDGWAQQNIPVPLIVGHEFVGEIVELGAEVDDLGRGDLGERRGPSRLRPLSQLHGGAPGAVLEDRQRRRQPSRILR